MLWIVGSLMVMGFGAAMARGEKRRLIDAMQRDGFTPAEIKRAMRHHSRGDTAKMADYCRGVVERNAVTDKPVANDGRDWTRADAYAGELV